MTPMARRSSATSAFGVSRRENHDASEFYRRFTPPVLSADADVHAEKALDRLVCGDARAMAEVPSASVALIVTSPPYFVGKEYEAALGQDGVPTSYLDYLSMLREVFAECVRTLEPGGRIAVNVANLGRRPYRSLSADVIGILQDDLGLLLRGELIWYKQRGSSGSCAWGSFQRPANPVLRDLTERVVIASKGRFDRAIPARQRQERGLPSEATMTREDFMEDTLDVWEIPPESAQRVGHPAPFPLELPARLIDLYTYRGDLVLDPFLGSGSTAVAAVRTGRHYVGYDLDPDYVALAEARVDAERARRSVDSPADLGDGIVARETALALLGVAGFIDVAPGRRLPGGVTVDFVATDASGRQWLFEVCGALTTYRSGLARADALWKALGKAAVIHAADPQARLVLLAPGLPAAGGPGAEMLSVACGAGRPVTAVVDLLAPDPAARLRVLGAVV
jgi:site-specific DNA-methyltransferase (adenine-specific)